MLRNIFIAAWRNALRDRVTTALNIGGLAIGMAAAILITLHVRHEASYDRFLTDYERVYHIAAIEFAPGRPDEHKFISQPELASLLSAEIPGLAGVARVQEDSFAVRHGEVEATEAVSDADPDFLTVLGLPVWRGDPATALKDPASLVLTRDMAMKYFGRDDVVGETLDLNRKYPVQVTAVLEDLPSNTHLKAKMFISSLAAYADLGYYDTHFRGAVAGAGALSSGNFNVDTYFRLAPGADASVIEAELPALVARHLPPDPRTGKVSVAYVVDPVVDLHLDPRGHDDNSSGRLTSLIALATVGVLVLLVAGINFVNLVTARASRRAIEVGVRKALGATRRQLILQFMGETMGYALVALVIAVSFVELVLPSVNAFLDHRLSFTYFRDPALAVGGLGVVVAIGLLAGIYPALVLSSFRPAMVLKRLVPGAGGAGRLRQTLVVLQFAVSIGLIIATGIIYRQTNFASRESLKFDHDQIALVQEGRAPCKGDLTERLAQAPGIRAVACSRAAPLNFTSSSRNMILPDQRQLDVGIQSVDFGFFELYSMKPLAGRLFERARGTDALSTDDSQPMAAPVVINEGMMRLMGFNDPAAAVGREVTVNGVRNQQRPVPIIGVIPDFQVESVREPVKPTVYFIDPTDFQLLSVKLDGQHFADGVASLDRLVGEAVPNLPPSHRFLDDEIGRRYRDITREGEVFAIFAGVSVLIACLGLFGLAAFTAERRTKEIGIRKALGASTADVVRLLVWQFAKPVLIANLVAWPVAWFVMRGWLDGFAYRIPLTPEPFLLAGASAVVIAVATTMFHAVRVARSRPVSALRYE
jgi:putative ABC transport system permease protein